MREYDELDPAYYFCKMQDYRDQRGNDPTTPISYILRESGMQF